MNRKQLAKELTKIAKLLMAEERTAAWSPDQVEQHLGNMAKAMKAGKMDAFKKMLDQLNRAKLAE